MNTPTVDCRNLPCPQPVITLKRLLDQQPPQQLTVIVDNDPALENVTRFLASRGYTSEHSGGPAIWHIRATCKTDGAVQPPRPVHAASAPVNVRQRIPGGEDGARTLVLIVTPVFGTGDDALGIKLMKNFLSTLPELGEHLWRIVLMNGGVTLAAADSPVITELKALEKAGVAILVCGTCLEHFGLLHKKKVGETTNMLDVVTSMQLAEKIIRV